MLWQSWQGGGFGPCIRDRQMMMRAMSDSYVMTDYVLTNNISQLVPNQWVHNYWLTIQCGMSPHTSCPGVDEDYGESKGHWTRFGRRFDGSTGRQVASGMKMASRLTTESSSVMKRCCTFSSSLVFYIMWRPSRSSFFQVWPNERFIQG